MSCPGLTISRNGTDRNGPDNLTILQNGTDACTRVRLQRCREAWATATVVHLTSIGQKRKDWREHIFANNLKKHYMNEVENCYIAGMTEHKNTV